MIKCLHGYNHCGLRDAMINDSMVEATCSRCESIETYNHIIKCNKIPMRKEFIAELLIELMKSKSENRDADSILSFGIMRCLENTEDDEFETNQQHVRMQELFRT